MIDQNFISDFPAMKKIVKHYMGFKPRFNPLIYYAGFGREMNKSCWSDNVLDQSLSTKVN